MQCGKRRALHHNGAREAGVSSGFASATQAICLKSYFYIGFSKGATKMIWKERISRLHAD